MAFIQGDRKLHRYMGIADSVALWSKDPEAKVGAVAVSPQGNIVSTGFNGFPRGILDSQERLNDKEVKNSIMIHAEMNCIINAASQGVPLHSCQIFVSGRGTCLSCAKALIQVGVAEVIMKKSDREASEKWLKDIEFAEMLYREASIKFYYI